MRSRSVHAGVVTGLVALALGACGSVGEDSSGGSFNVKKGAESGPIKVGLVAPAVRRLCAAGRGHEGRLGPLARRSTTTSSEAARSRRSS